MLPGNYRARIFYFFLKTSFILRIYDQAEQIWEEEISGNVYKINSAILSNLSIGYIETILSKTLCRLSWPCVHTA